MAILQCNFNINFGQTLAPGSSLCKTSTTLKVTGMSSKLYYSRVHGQTHLGAQFTSGVLWHFQNAPWKAGFSVLKGQKMRPPCNYKTKSQRSEPQWLLKYLITPNFSAKFQPNRLTTTFGPWNTFSDNDTQLKGQEFFKEHKKLKHRKVYGKITLPWR